MVPDGTRPICSWHVSVLAMDGWAMGACGTSDDHQRPLTALVSAVGDAARLSSGEVRRVRQAVHVGYDYGDLIGWACPDDRGRVQRADLAAQPVPSPRRPG